MNTEIQDQYKFYGAEDCDVRPINPEYSEIRDPRHLYDILSGIWCADTCTSRLRDKWSTEDKTLGQCSITAFLVKEIFGGEVYGVKTEEGFDHCFNMVDGHTFDLTSEQFHGRPLDYTPNRLKTWDSYIAGTEREERYHILKELIRCNAGEV